MDSSTPDHPTDHPAPERRSPLLDRPGAVPASPPDAGVAAHYGDPLREQRLAETAAVVVDRSNRDVVRVDGPDRLSWLHSLTSQHLAELAPMRGTEALLLSPHGHVEHHLVVADDGASTWLDVEPGTAAALVGFLESMRFLLRVEPVDAGGQTAVLSLLGPRSDEVVEAVFGAAAVPPAAERTTAPDAAGAVTTGPYPVTRARTGAGDEGGDGGGATAGAGDTLVRRMPYGLDLLVPRAGLADVVDRLTAAGAGLAGLAAFEALRIADRRPRLGLDTDHRTIPHEVGWLASAVHLDKGCYRGQETVARVHNLGRPPRRLVLLHLDGAVAAAGCQVTAGGRSVGFVGSSQMHHELGPIALAVVKRSVAADTPLVVSDPDGNPVAAAIDPDSGPALPERPAGRLHRPVSA